MDPTITIDRVENRAFRRHGRRSMITILRGRRVRDDDGATSRQRFPFVAIIRGRPVSALNRAWTPSSLKSFRIGEARVPCTRKNVEAVRNRILTHGHTHTL